MTQGENVHLSPWKKRKRKEKKKKFPIKDRKKRKRRKFPIKDWKKAKKEEDKINIQKGLCTRQYLNNTELSQANKKRKETTA